MKDIAMDRIEGRPRDILSAASGFLLVTAGTLVPSGASAHVKWFEAYEVAAKPVPILSTLALPYFWLGLLLVLGFFLATTLLERRQPGLLALRGLDAATSRLREHADHFLLSVLAAFFVSLFAVGGTYLTPDLKTQSELVPWAQIVIAALIPMRRTRPIAAVAIVVLWLFTLRDYDLFHLFDYLALGLGLAGYLLLSGLPDGKWHDRRFGVLRWGIALALTWSSMEKFMYPQWFMPLLEEKPFLAFGIPFGPYTTMSGVAEFTLGFGLLWTPLVRRLSAFALFALMFAAVYPFGRVDMIGHATILASLLIVVADPQRADALEVAPKGRAATLFVPAGLAAALAITMMSYAGLHNVIYERATGQIAALLRAGTMASATNTGVAPGAFWRGNEHYHGETGASSAPDAGAVAEMMEQMNAMHEATSRVSVSGDVNRDFVALMVPHHQAAIDMARTYLESGSDPKLRQLAEHIIADQEAEIAQMKAIFPAGAVAMPSHH
ncbi:DUF305 domain-containing protein [Rhizobium sp. NTR19]|uniref:DUF305 domain-containing protein n=1 Tax=Neorhizobium turbinariae TaxID=2937795 RepID=A0ABT0IXA4_9HYPH|nr:DUF305 domain-containing protein [Neorhizobium turbinariae]MCK8782493.1 DUF305 domain-containing protein [Neorhizobium turbinariae]